jgi:cell wall-associated NlpC family hydrolase
MTNHAICLLSVVPIRETISHRSEMVTQLLFGELCVIEDQYQSWYKIRVQFDNYEGWVEKKQLHLIDEKTYKEILNQSIKTYVNAPVAFAYSSERGEIPVLLGSSLPLFENGKFKIGSELFTLEGGEDYQQSRQTPERLSFWALKYVKTPYLWGGRSPFGIDCSGFVQNVYRICGYSLPRDSAQQANLGQVVNFIAEAMPGDLLFFDNAEGQIIHVGIFVGNNQVIHASGEVRIDKIDHQGIFNETTGTYSHQLRLIKRLV